VNGKTHSPPTHSLLSSPDVSPRPTYRHHCVLLLRMCPAVYATCAHAVSCALQVSKLKQYVEELKGQRAELELKVRTLALALQQQPQQQQQQQQQTESQVTSRIASETSSFSPLTEAAAALHLGQVPPPHRTHTACAWRGVAWRGRGPHGLRMGGITAGGVCS
jgi:hypothetical protein